MKTSERLTTSTRNLLTTVDAHRSSVVLFGIFVAATLMLGTGVFVYDAATYWIGAQNLASGTVGFPGMSVRGILSATVYLPAALVSALFGPQFAPFAVLLQNAIVLAAAAVILLPRIAGMWRPIGDKGKRLGALLFWIVTVGFAPYPLMDLYPALGLLVMLALFRAQFPFALVVAGLLAGISVNLRPAYLVPVILVALVVVVWRRWSSLKFIAGIALGLVPQFVFNGVFFKNWTIWPVTSDNLIALQAGYASYVIRYDTLLGAATPQQFYCSPAMAAQLQGELPTSPGELALAFLSNMPNSIVFALQKIAAALQWPVSTPYTVPAPGLDALFATTVTAITMIGIVALVRCAIVVRAKWSSDTWFGRAAFAALTVGSVLTLVSSATESRFGLPVVLLGIVGCMTLASVSARAAIQHKWWVVGSLLLVVVVLFFGFKGLSHPAPAGDATQATCAELLR